MNTLTKVILPASLAVSLISCGGMDKKDNANAAKTDSTSGASVANKVAAAMNSANAASGGNSDYAEKLKERRAKGDTLAMPYADLEKYLPTSIDGYTAEAPTGATVNMAQASYSGAHIMFKKGNGDWVKVSIIDYNQAYQLYTTASMAWSMGLSVDSPTEKADGVKLDNTQGGWEVYKKNTKQATITLGVGSRFWVNVDANNQPDVEMVKSIAKSIDLSKLASL